MSYLQDRMDDMLKQGDDMAVTIDNMQQMYDLMGQLNAVTHDMVGKMHLTLRGHQGPARQHRQFRRLLPADP